ncbi:MAG: energy transducer TonB [Terriglobales bacterium]
MECPDRNSVKLLVELEPRRRAFWSSVRAALHPVPLSDGGELGLWRDVFVRQPLPWRRFFQSAVLHAGALALIWMVSLAWIRQQSMLARPAFDRSSLITYSPEEYLPPLDTGRSESEPASQGDPVYAKQSIISVPREADNRTQTIVTPPDLHLDRDVALPNIVAVAPTAPAIPLDATRAPLRMMTAATETSVVAPAPELNAARSRTDRNALNSDVIAPPPEVAVHHARGVAGPDAAVVEPPPELPKTVRGPAGQINIGPSEVVAPAPQLAVAVQHSVAGRGIGNLAGGGVQPVAPPPSINGTGGVGSGGRLIALGIHPAALGPVAAPQGRRKGTFAATPEGRLGGSGTPGQAEAAAGAANRYGKGNKGGSGNGESRGDSSLPSGLHVGAPDSTSIATIAGSGGRGKNGRAGDERLVASANTPRAGSSPHSASPVPEDKVTEVDRQVFRGKRFYSMTMNMPNLNSATGSWVIRFAEIKASRQPGELLAPVATEGSDPGYPLELMRSNVQGTVTLYAVIDSVGAVGDIRVLNSPDTRLDRYATAALARWKFLPATKDGTPVALEAVVMIPFRLKRSF